jgi:hypothetical protein
MKGLTQRKQWVIGWIDGYDGENKVGVTPDLESAVFFSDA